MSKLLRGLAAGYGAKKLGGGCFSTVLLFVIVWWLLGPFGVFLCVPGEMLRLDFRPVHPEERQFA